MRVVIQRVSEASVSINDRIQSSIKKGLLILLGIEESDSMDDIIWLSNKVTNLRVFNDANETMNICLKDIDGDILLVSQFTLFASTKKGNRPSYIKASKSEFAIPVYESMIKQLELELEKKIKTGVFGANMKIALVNDGPVTILIDSKNKE